MEDGRDASGGCADRGVTGRDLVRDGSKRDGMEHTIIWSWCGA